MVIETLFRLSFQNYLENSEIVLQQFSRVEYLASRAILWQQQCKYMVIGNYFLYKIGHYNWQLVNKQKQIKIKQMQRRRRKVVNKNKSKREDQAVLPLPWFQFLGHIYVQPIQSDCSACVCVYILSSVLWCFPQFPHTNYARSFLLPVFFVEEVMSYLRYMCLLRIVRLDCKNWIATSVFSKVNLFCD